MAFSAYRDVLGCSDELADVEVTVTSESADKALVWPTRPEGALPDGLEWATVSAAGFAGEPRTSLVVPGAQPTVLVGLGAEPTPADWRDAVGLGSRAASPHTALAVRVDAADADVVRAAVEGALLARYRYDALRAEPKGHRIAQLDVVLDEPDDDAAVAVRTGLAYAIATARTRDLANTPHNHLTATRLAQLATDLGADAGLDVEVWDQDRIAAEGLGAVLAVNAGSKEEARFIRLRYSPDGESTGRLALVGKGIMYDSGGIGLKPNDDSHSQMKNDMTGAAAILAAMLALRQIGGTAEVIGYLMCTDNMPSASATALGDIARGRSGKTIEIIDTDAEGRLVLSDGITLAVEDGADAIVDIATLTGSVARAFGPLLSGLSGSAGGLVDAIAACADATGEPVARMPLEHGYRPQIDSPVADLRNVGPLGQPDGIISALFLHEFTDGRPWAHLDIAGTAWSTIDAGWRTPGCSGTGARTLAAFAKDFTRG